MVTDELQKYIIDSLKAGNPVASIRQSLLESGWQSADIEEAFSALGTVLAEQITPNRGIFTRRFARVGVIVAFIASVGTGVYIWQDQLDLRNANASKTREFYTRIAESHISFTDSGTMVFPDEQKFLTEKNRYIAEKTNFIETDLRTMTLTLYAEGVPTEQLQILSKGKERSWWETPTGNYSVLGKSVNGYSSIGRVWMPYSIQFYGNYLIHGWPHYDDGTPVSKGYSGGCIRLSDADAKKIFDFAKVGMPVLVLEEHIDQKFGTLFAKGEKAALPEIGAQAFLVQDLASGETLLEKNVDEKRAVASLTKLMTAVVAHEVIYLGRSVQTTSKLLAGAQMFTPVEGERYIGLDLLYPLLMQSSNLSAKLLASFVGEGAFIGDMNAKALSLEMKDTTFADASGISAGNISTARDLARLLQYIYFKRPFLFDISRGVMFEEVGILRIGDTIAVKDLKNVNEFLEYPDLIGVKNGKTTAAGETMATVWNVERPDGNVPVAIIVLGSEDRAKDTLRLHTWLTENYAK
ncbi:MAG: hypothetical protein EXS51_01695 [Candidatus Taylorbacteria bacterium]|nr:hypothetical protein [Candidatus Taylorbacteria bacterium]